MFRILLLVFCTSAFAQSKQPLMFRWQDKHARKQVKKHLAYDTLIATSAARLHISYSKDPKKPYLLMLHGMGANARSNWGSQIGPLSKRFNLILPDLIYFGESTSSSQNYSVEFQVQQLQEALVALGISDSLNVMGFSYGGLTAAMYNELYQPNVKTLIIIDGPVKFFSARTADSLATAVGISGINNVVAPTTVQGFDGMKKAVMSSWFPATNGLKRKLIKYFFLPTKATRDLQMKYLITHEALYRQYSYKLDKTPTLLIWGEKDGVIPVSVGRALHAAFPATTTLLVFPKAKHDAHFKERKALNKAVIAFITGH
jgi:pimeloyl-ACP methyl ester carboxylesterase